MRWFKHFTDNHRGQSIQALMDEHGHAGPCCYWILVELCAEKLERKLDGNPTEDDCVFTFHRRAIEWPMRLRSSAVDRLLSSCQLCNLVTFKKKGEFYEIKMPILLDLLDYDSKRSRSRRVQVAAGSRLESESESESDTDIESEKDITDSKESVSAELSKSVQRPRKEIPKIAYHFTADHKAEFRKELHEKWANEFGTEFLESEFRKVSAWILANPKKAPKSDWGRFLNAWLYRSWESQRKLNPANPGAKNRASAMMDHFKKLHDDINAPNQGVENE